jgi:hypothetical protein
MILERRRIETADARIVGSKQPYHAAKDRSAETAETFLRQCRESSTALSIRGIAGLVSDVTQNGLTVAHAAVLASGRPLPSLTAILRSHALIHTAEGEFFREILIAASEHCSLEVTKVSEREIWQTGAKVFRFSIPDLQQRIGQLGTSVGPPWRQDEKFASLAGWIALFSSK